MCTILYICISFNNGGRKYLPINIIATAVSVTNTMIWQSIRFAGNVSHTLIRVENYYLGITLILSNVVFG